MTEESIFSEALTRRTPADRSAYLDEACAGDGALRRRIEGLLLSHDGAGNFLQIPAVVQIGLGTDRSDDTAGPRPPEPTLDLRPPSDRDGEDPGHPRDDEDLSLDFLRPSDDPDSLGRLGHYEVKEVVGLGGMGVVLRAFDTKLHRVVAIKVMAGSLAASATARRRFSREAQAAAAVCHEHVVTIHAVEEDHRPPYLIMQFVEGVSLQDKLDRGGVQGLREILRIGLQTAEGLAAAHKQGLVHRDIKPANILLENGVERVKITDFGLARAADDASLTQSGVIAGTPQYMSPEQAEGAAVDQRSDLFSLGSLLYANCTGRPPFRAPSNLAVLRCVVEDTPRPIREINLDIPEWLCALIARLQAKDPAQRPGSADEVATILARRLAELQQPSPAPMPAETPSEGRRGPAPLPKPSPVTLLPGSRRRTAPFLLATAASLVILLGAGLSEATGLSHFTGTILRLIRPEGTLVVEVDDPGVSVSVDGGDLVVSGGGVREFRLRPGTHELQTRKGEVVLRSEIVEIERNGRRIVRATSTPPSRPVTGAPPEPVAVVAPRTPALPSSPGDWDIAVFHLPVEEQVKAVSARLKEVNHGFDGRLRATYKDGVVHTLSLCTDAVKDISPVGALRELRDLTAQGSEMHKGRLSDLGPLKGLRRLLALGLLHNDVKDLEPLTGLPLVAINLGFNPVHDLKPLAGMPMGAVYLWNTDITDLSPLTGMPIHDLNLTVTAISDLSPLKGMPLESLWIGYTRVTDLSPLRGLPLRELDVNGTMIQNLDPMKGAQLIKFHYTQTPIPDISILRGMPLESIQCDF